MTYNFSVSSSKEEKLAQPKLSKVIKASQARKVHVFNPKEIEEAARSTREMVERIRSHSIINQHDQ